MQSYSPFEINLIKYKKKKKTHIDIDTVSLKVKPIFFSQALFLNMVLINIQHQKFLELRKQFKLEAAFHAVFI